MGRGASGEMGGVEDGLGEEVGAADAVVERDAPTEKLGVGVGVGRFCVQALITTVPGVPLAPAVEDCAGNQAALLVSANVALTKELPPPPPA